MKAETDLALNNTREGEDEPFGLHSLVFEELARIIYLYSG
jgi:hypothetical protein